MRTKTATRNPAIGRVRALVLATVAICFAILLIGNALSGNGNRPVGWQMQIINALAESLFDNIAFYYDRMETR